MEMQDMGRFSLFPHVIEHERETEIEVILVIYPHGFYLTVHRQTFFGFVGGVVQV